MFIHWGLISLARGCWAQYHERTRHADYRKLVDRFRPRRCKPAEWAELAHEAGMRYAVFSSRHHDGFCMFDSRTTDFTSMNSPAGRDFVAEFVEAFRDAGLKVGLYYSLLDWRFPGYFERKRYRKNAEALVEQAHEQVRELLTNYGRIDLVWFDGHWFQDHVEYITEKPEVLAEFWRARDLIRMMRRLQPHIIINDRTGLPGDFDTSEQKIAASKPGRAWEVCQTIGNDMGWSYLPFNTTRKSPAQQIHEIVFSAFQGGNYLLNVGPSPNGTIIAPERRRLRAIGEWMRTNGEALYGSQRAPEFGAWYALWTRKENTGYLNVLFWQGKEIVTPLIAAPVKRATMLATGEPVKFRTEYNGRLVFYDLPPQPPDPCATVIKVQFDGPFKTITEKNKAAWITGEIA